MLPHIFQWQNEKIEAAFAASGSYGEYPDSSLKVIAPKEHEYITTQELSPSNKFGLSGQVPPKKTESTEDRNKNLQPEKAEEDSCKIPDLELGTITKISKTNSHKDTSNLFTDAHIKLSTFQPKETYTLNHNLKEALFGRKKVGGDSIGVCAR